MVAGAFVLLCGGGGSWMGLQHGAAAGRESSTAWRQRPDPGPAVRSWRVRRLPQARACEAPQRAGLASRLPTRRTLPGADPPAPQIFRDGKLDAPAAYEGPRDEAGIVKYLKKQVGGPRCWPVGGGAVRLRLSSLPRWHLLAPTPFSGLTPFI